MNPLQVSEEYKKDIHNIQAEAADLINELVISEILDLLIINEKCREKATEIKKKYKEVFEKESRRLESIKNLKIVK